MALLNDVIQRFESQRFSIGKSLLNVIFPNDVESYFITLELATISGVIIDLLTFPINPQSMKENSTFRNNSSYTSTGVNVVYNPGFVQKEISFEGNFGRKFKSILSRTLTEFFGVSSSRTLIDSSTLKKEGHRHRDFLRSKYGKEFNTYIKTGYGLIKVLEKIINLSQTNDVDGNPYILRLYNGITGNNYIVIPKSLNVSMSVNQNTIHSYSITLMAVAYSDDLKFSTFSRSGVSSRLSSLSYATLDKIGNNLLDAITSINLSNNKIEGRSNDLSTTARQGGGGVDGNVQYRQ